MKRKTFEQIERMAQLFSLPADTVAGCAKIEIVSDRQALVFNHQGIIEYTQEQVSINSKSRLIKISGTDLKVAAMNSSSLKITGNIIALEFV